MLAALGRKLRHAGRLGAARRSAPTELLADDEPHLKRVLQDRLREL